MKTNMLTKEEDDSPKEKESPVHVSIPTQERPGNQSRKDPGPGHQSHPSSCSEALSRLPGATAQREPAQMTSTSITALLFTAHSYHQNGNVCIEYHRPTRGDQLFFFHELRRNPLSLNRIASPSFSNRRRINAGSKQKVRTDRRRERSGPNQTRIRYTQRGWPKSPAVGSS